MEMANWARQNNAMNTIDRETVNDILRTMSSHRAGVRRRDDWMGKGWAGKGGQGAETTRVGVTWTRKSGPVAAGRDANQLNIPAPQALTLS